MSTHTFAAVRGHIGTTEYFMAKVPARDLGSIAIPASELDEWDSWTISERIQRELAMPRILNELAPYLIHSKDRFFGSLIITVIEPDMFSFKSAGEMCPDLEAAYQSEFESMGVLTVSGGKMVALDGQHRLVALREIVTGRIEADSQKAAGVARDEVCVMFIHHETLEGTRRIFNKVNRHARPTSASDNIITSEDDGYAIVARWLTEDDPPLELEGPSPPLGIRDDDGEPLVEWRKPNLTGRDSKLTTLTVLCKTVRAILDVHGLVNFDEKHLINRPDNDDLEKAYTWSATWWQVLLDGLPAFRTARDRPEWIPDFRDYNHKWSLLFRPIAQVAVFRGLGHAFAAGVTLEEAVSRLDEIRWSASEDQWTDIIIRRNGRVITGDGNVGLTGRLIGYLIAAEELGEDFTKDLQRSYAMARGWLPESDAPYPPSCLLPPPDFP